MGQSQGQIPIINTPTVSDNDKQLQIHPTTNGLAVIVTIDLDEGHTATKKDGESLKDTFSSLNFSTFWFRNVHKTEIKGIINNIKGAAYPPELSGKFKCIVFAFSGHGGENDVLVAQDNEKFNLSTDIVNPLIECKKIAHIPKLFFIDACRGKLTVQTTPAAGAGGQCQKCMPTTTPLDLGKLITALQGNYLIAYATLPHKVSLAKKDQGSTWMQLLAKELKTDDTVQNILERVKAALFEKYVSVRKEKNLQQPETLSRLVCGPLNLQVCQ